jgi:OOP family OmpA-OmpF porin
MHKPLAVSSFVTRTILVAGLSCVCQQLTAAEAPTYDQPGPYLGVGLGHAWLGNDWGTADAGYGMQLLLGWPLSDTTSIELASSYFNMETGQDEGTDFYRSSLGLDLRWAPFQFKWRPFVIAGAGAAYHDVYPDKDGAVLMASVGIGLLSPPLGRYGVRLRVDGRAVRDWQGSGSGIDRYAFLGASIPLRPVRYATPHVEVREVVREVIREVPVRVLVPVPAPVAVTAVDTDRDGVTDDRDRCLNTLPGSEVDKEGCATQYSVVTLQGVHFETGSARLARDSLSILSQAAAALNGQPTMHIEVRGHTDADGSEAANQTLSHNRAHAVVDFLLENGIAADRLEAIGFGESRPIADNTTAEGRARNRRVEFRVVTR